MNEQELTILKKKTEYFFENKIPVHIKKHNGYFHNGLILELESDLFILDDEKNKAMPIYYMEVLEIEKKEDKKC
jgi:prenyltransferase beta subunit|tara:strand:+ start:67 stop:288 length:222 start_codon:yes stop_codon:yes gene_type:complete